MHGILFVDGEQNLRAFSLAQKLQLSLSFSTRKIFIKVFFSEYSPSSALKYNPSEKGHYFTVHISYFETKINKNQNISVLSPLSADHIDIFQFIKIKLTKIHVPQTGSL